MMYIIVENDKYGATHTYRESKKHYKKAEKIRQELGMRRLDPAVLDDECDLSHYGKGCYFVFQCKR
jgi:hypothetical protein